MLDKEIDYYFVDNNHDFKFYAIESAREFAKELSRELHYYPTIKMVATIIDDNNY